MGPLLVPDAFIRTYVGDRGWGHVLVRRARGRRMWLTRFERAVAEACDGERNEERIAREVETNTGQGAPTPRTRRTCWRWRRWTGPAWCSSPTVAAECTGCWARGASRGGARSTRCARCCAATSWRWEWRWSVAAPWSCRREICGSRAR